MHGKESPGSRTGETEPEVRPQKVTSFAGRTGVQAGSQGVCVYVCVCWGNCLANLQAYTMLCFNISCFIY